MPKDHGERGADAGEAAPAVVGVAPGRRPLTSLAFPPRAAPAGEPAEAGLDLRLRDPGVMSDVINEFQVALQNGKRDDAEWAWARASEADRLAWGSSPGVGRELNAAYRTLGVSLVPVMAQAGLDFTGRASLVATIIDGPHLGQYVDAMFTQSDDMAVSFLVQLPPHSALTAAAKVALGRILTGANSVDAARFAFGRLHGGHPVDESYAPETLKTRAWTQAALERVHRVLVVHGGQEHIRSVSHWYVGTEYKDDASDPAFQRMGHAWYHGGRVVLPDASMVTGGGGTAHRMVGGTKAHTEPGKEPKAGAMGTLNHLELSVLHEVGHGVGDALGGNDWARSHPFVDWQTSMDPDTWSAQLWGDDDALTAASRVKFPVDDLPTSRDARLYIAGELVGRRALPPRWEALRFEALLDNCYADQPLYKYWKKSGHKPGESFMFAGTANYGHDDRVYVWLSRGGSGLASYTQAAHRDKVSWYSLSSPHEWFAEQYVAYYHHQPRGGGLDAGAKAKLDDIHQQKAAIDDPGSLAPFDNAAADSAPAAPSAAGIASDRVPLPW